MTVRDSVEMEPEKRGETQNTEGMFEKHYFVRKAWGWRRGSCVHDPEGCGSLVLTNDPRSSNYTQQSALEGLATTWLFL